MLFQDMHDYEVESLVRIAGEIADKWGFVGARAVIRNADAALILDPEHAIAHLLRAKARCWLGEWEQAIDDFQAADSIDSKLLDADLLFLMGLACDQDDKEIEACECFTRSVKLDPCVFTSNAEGAWPWYLVADIDKAIKGLEWTLAFVCKTRKESDETIGHLVEKYQSRSVERLERGDVSGAESDQERLGQLKVKVDDLSREA